VNMKNWIVLVAASLSLSGCLSAGLDRASPGAQAVAVAKPGGAVASTIIAAMNGGLVGGPIGEGLDNGDRRLALESEYRALEYTPAAQGVKWQGSGDSGEVVAAQPYRVGSQNCRQYEHTVSVDGRTRNARGTACRNPDGSWTPLS
jgi:surface antigen